MRDQGNYHKAARILRESKRSVAFTGAGVSVESGIPSFRGEDGLWSKFNPEFLDIGYFQQFPEQSWALIKDIFYDFFSQARPNNAHRVLATLEKRGLLQALITQNIDNLHQQAGSRVVYEFHGTAQEMVCTACSHKYHASQVDLQSLPPLCRECGGLLKPDFVFFGEPIPEPARSESFREAKLADVFLLIGTTGEIMPASAIPIEAKSYGARIIEVNVEASNYTGQITDVFLQGKATVAMAKLSDALDELE